MAGRGHALADGGTVKGPAGKGGDRGGTGKDGAGKGKANLVLGAIIAACLVAALIAVFAMRFPPAGAAGLSALVHDSEGAVHELSLAEDSTVTVTTELGTNVVEVRDGAVSVREADCDNQDCVHQGSIDAPGRQIICLPHKLWIEVAASGSEGGQLDVAAVAGGGSGDEEPGADVARGDGAEGAGDSASGRGADAGGLDVVAR